MGRPPAYLFVVRHGNRLDAADKQWHLTSPTPYDPPLTYGGWLQARALGARIAGILRERELEDHARANSASSPDRKHRRRKYKVAIHSSPFLRCVQTSIAISAGLAQSPLLLSNRPPSPPRSAGKQMPKPSSPLIRPTVLSDLPEEDEEPSAKRPTIEKTVLRLDAFLGEWLTPSYFELITPPPKSVMMIAGAKADLLRRESYSLNGTANNTHLQPPSHGKLWGGDRLAPPTATRGEEPERPSALENLTHMSRALPKTSPKRSMTQVYENGGSGLSNPAAPPQTVTSDQAGYVAPVPGYAISSSAPIPQGYVAHARDACAAVDYQWDSARDPLSWGDGGSYGEEWATMHRRFRNGLQRLVDWYATSEHPEEMVTKTAATNGTAVEDGVAHAEEPEDEETESVVIMVSHGAGCNALIGGITHQPVLMDVQMASLTMAARKAPFELETPRHDAPSSVPIDENYDLTLFGNTDHLRTGTPSSSRSSSLANINNPRGRFHSNSLSDTHQIGLDANNRSSSASAALGTSMRRGSGASGQRPVLGPSRLAVGYATGPSVGGITVGSGVTSFSPAVVAGRSAAVTGSPSTGLWTPPVAAQEEVDTLDEEAEGMLLDFSYEKEGLSKAEQQQQQQERPHAKEEEKELIAASVPVERPPPIERPQTPPPRPETPEVEKVEKITSPHLGHGAGGLWGAPRPSPADTLREVKPAKRRWTVNER